MLSLSLFFLKVPINTHSLTHIHTLSQIPTQSKLGALIELDHLSEHKYCRQADNDRSNRRLLSVSSAVSLLVSLASGQPSSSTMNLSMFS